MNEAPVPQAIEVPDLHALLAAASIPPPYVLVGHPIGGIIARRFYARYPDLVAGMLLVDSSHEEQAEREAVVDWRQGRVWYVKMAVQRQARMLGIRRLAAALGLMRGLDSDIALEAPPEYAGAARAILLSTRQRRAVVRELLMMTGTLGPPLGLGSIPLTALTRTARPQRVWTLMQDELAALSSDSRHVTVAGAGHYIQRDKPELVIQAILDLVRRCR